MVVRDLSRHLTQHRTLPHGIELFEHKLRINTRTDREGLNNKVWLMSTLEILYNQAGYSELATNAQEDALKVLFSSVSVESEPGGMANAKTAARVVWTKNELGRMYRHNGRYELAEQMHLQALQSLTASSSSEDRLANRMEVAWTQSTLARVYRCRQDYERALAYSSVSYAARVEVLGPLHPHSLWVQSDMAQMYLEKGDYKKAVELHRQVLSGRREVLGDGDLDTCWTMNNLGVALTKQMTHESLIEARTLQEEALAVQEKRLGSAHPHTLWTREQLDDLVSS
jgi:tetratricopeptide (TPR) repeat protein